MKRITILLFVLSICAQGLLCAQATEGGKPSSQGMAQDDEIKTIFGGSKIKHGGYGAFGIRYTPLNNLDGMSIGGRGGWVINHSLTLGGGGYGFFTESAHNPIMAGALMYQDQVADDYKYTIGGGYGGLLIEPTLWSKHPIHLSFPIIIGAGGVAYTRDYLNDLPSSDTTDKAWADYKIDEAAFFAVQSGVELELNMLKFFRIGLGVYYLYTSDVSLQVDTPVGMQQLVDGDVLRGFSYGLCFKFGYF